MGLKRQIAKNTSISFSGKIISSILGFISIAFMARELGQEGFGSYSTVVAFLYIFSVFADFGLYNFLTREISKPESEERRITSHVFTLRVLLLLFFYSLSFIIVYFIPVYSIQIKTGVLLASLGFAFLSLSQVLMGVFQKYLKTMYPALADVVARTVQLCFVIFLFYRGADFLDFLLVFVLGAFLNFLLVFYFTRKYIDFSFIFNKKELKAILVKVWPLAASAILVLIYFKGDTLILSFLKSQEDVGTYNLAYKVIENIIFFPAMFVGLVMPLLSKYFVVSLADFKKVFQKAFDFLNIISIPIVFGGFYLAADIVKLIGGDGFSNSIIVFKILIFSTFFIFLGALFGNAIIAIHKQKEVVYVYGLAAIFNISANLYFIERYSYLGASFVNVVTEFIATSFMFLIVYKNIKYLPRLTPSFKAFISSLIMIAVLWLFPIQNFFLLLSIGVVVYFSFMYLIKGISKEDFLMFVNK